MILKGREMKKLWPRNKPPDFPKTKPTLGKYEPFCMALALMDAIISMDDARGRSARHPRLYFLDKNYK
jgi:hypothetical protein